MCRRADMKKGITKIDTRQDKNNIKELVSLFRSTKGVHYITEECTQSTRVSSVNLGHTPAVRSQPPTPQHLFPSHFLVWPWMWCSSFVPPPQSAVYLAGPQCTVHDSLPAQGVHQGDEWRGAAPTVLLPGEGTTLLWRWALSHISFLCLNRGIFVGQQ